MDAEGEPVGTPTSSSSSSSPAAQTGEPATVASEPIPAPAVTSSSSSASSTPSSSSFEMTTAATRSADGEDGSSEGGTTGAGVEPEEPEEVDLSTIATYQGSDISVDDEQIRREVWAGAVPVAIVLAETELATGERPQPFYLLASRLAYFPVICGEAVGHFQPHAVANSGEFWLETAQEQTPLKWHYPVGVLFDLYGDRACLPWRLVLHFHRFPFGQLIRCERGAETARAHYMNVLKEADYLKYAMNSQVQKLPLKQTRNLWQAVAASHYDLYHQINESLQARPLLAVPIRLVRPKQHFVQQPVAPFNPDGSEKLLRTVLSELAPQKDFSRCQVVVQGILPSLDTPIVWLSKICMHPEHFLWIVLL
ncbi:MAG: autophagy protein 5 [archaeon]|nr:autophagy protein 5 [archaeon]